MNNFDRISSYNRVSVYIFVFEILGKIWVGLMGNGIFKDFMFKTDSCI